MLKCRSNRLKKDFSIFLLTEVCRKFILNYLLQSKARGKCSCRDCSLHEYAEINNRCLSI